MRITDTKFNADVTWKIRLKSNVNHRHLILHLNDCNEHLLPTMSILTRLLVAVLCFGSLKTHSVAESSQFCEKDGLKENCGETKEDRSTFSSSLGVRYLLYDVNPPEGFNLRRDVYMRLAIFMHEMKNEENWRLVLPPWGQLYHWQSSNVGEQTKLPWRMFFDVKSLQKFAPVIEMEEFLGSVQKKRPPIDEVYILQHYKDVWEEGKEWQDRWNIEGCIESIPYSKSGKAYTGPFWTYKNLSAQKVECASFQGHAALLKGILRQSRAKVVMIDHAEVALHDRYGDHIYWECRRSMRFARHLVEIAQSFRKQQLDSSDDKDMVKRPDNWLEEREYTTTGGGPYLAVHLRRKDFLWGRAKQVPDLQFAADQIEKIIKKLQLETIFIATDAPKHEFAELKTHLSKFKVLRFEPSPTLKYEIKDGGVAIVDQIICSHAKYFIGTHESTFSFRIQEEREIMGFQRNTTFNRLCGREEGIPCTQPTQWPIVFK
ncbi:GDP-fucose protein O-fucosyltransferase 2 [Frankliniella fusca]|uniref:GDP-fucose protein O-fucosyltransferase 2 n=1 Tax=Frankliniella fusca TaxID=407009 RepID=A0AAE1LAG0_9NEOP|nr:GDP-fucose protein O-fucosyltransferase 2 [Frankliniella fusca]